MSAEAFGPVEAQSDTHDVEAFDSGVAGLDGWLRRSARVAAGAGTAATYVVCRGRRIVGFYALAMSAVDRSEQGRHFGGHLLVDALRRCVRGGREFGARAVVVDAITPDAAAFYRHFGFHGLDDGRLWRRLADIERRALLRAARASALTGPLPGSAAPLGDAGNRPPSRARTASHGFYFSV